MEVTMNGKVFQYSIDFRKQHPDTFKILTDENHKIYLVENHKYDDLIIFVSPKQKMVDTIPMSEFEDSLRKQNRRLFFNIVSLFNDCFEADESQDITYCRVISRDVFLKYINSKYIFKDINMLKVKHDYLFYFSPEEEIGKEYDYKSILAIEDFKKQFNIMPQERIFVDMNKDELIVVDPFSGKLKEIDVNSIKNKQCLNQFERISEPWDRFSICDARELYKVSEGEDLKLDACILYIKDKVLYVCFIKDYTNFKNLAAVSKFLYNNSNEQLLKKMQTELKTTDLIYLTNGENNDCIIYKDGDNYRYKLLKDFNLKENISDVMSAFKIKIDIKDFNTNCLLAIKAGKEEDIPDDRIELEPYYFWLSYFDKTLYIFKK